EAADVSDYRVAPGDRHAPALVATLGGEALGIDPAGPASQTVDAETRDGFTGSSRRDEGERGSPMQPSDVRSGERSRSRKAVSLCVRCDVGLVDGDRGYLQCIGRTHAGPAEHERR